MYQQDVQSSRLLTEDEWNHYTEKRLISGMKWFNLKSLSQPLECIIWAGNQQCVQIRQPEKTRHCDFLPICVEKNPRHKINTDLVQPTSLGEIKNLQKHQPKNFLPFLAITNLLQSKNRAGTTFCDLIPFIPLLTLFIVTEAVSGMGFLTSPHNSLKGQ